MSTPMEAFAAITRANTGHGHVRPRPDGVRARCGGPGLCAVCQREAAGLAHEDVAVGLKMKAAEQMYEALHDLLHATFEDGDGNVRDISDCLPPELIRRACAALDAAEGRSHQESA